MLNPFVARATLVGESYNYRRVGVSSLYLLHILLVLSSSSMKRVAQWQHMHVSSLGI